MFTPLKIFGTGQVTLPKEWRDKVKTLHLIAEETPQGLLIKPLTTVEYYEMDEENFGLNFPMGMEASKLLKELKKADKKIHGKVH